jgi:hypothetical protein
VWFQQTQLLDYLHSRRYVVAQAELFKSGLVGLTRKYGDVRAYLWKHWRELRLAIEECQKVGATASEMPFAISRTFIRIVSEQGPAERILAEKEQITG